MIETGSLSTEPGDAGHRPGTEVQSASSEGIDGTKLQIEVPVFPDKVDMVEIYYKSGNEISRLSQLIILKDYKDNRPGLKRHVNKKPGFELRVCLIDITDIPSSRRESA